MRDDILVWAALLVFISVTLTVLLRYAEWKMARGLEVVVEYDSEERR